MQGGIFFILKNKEKSISQIMRFAVNIVVCYLLAYGLAKPLCLRLLAGTESRMRDNVSMLAGMCLFTGFNYLGQRFLLSEMQRNKPPSIEFTRNDIIDHQQKHTRIL